MNEVWNLDVIYRGFDDPAFAADMEKLEKLVQDYVCLLYTSPSPRDS